LLTTRNELESNISGRSRKTWCSLFPESRHTTIIFEPSRSGAGVCAIKRSGKSKSKSAKFKVMVRESNLGACPSIRRGRAQGACTARARREEEAMRCPSVTTSNAIAVQAPFALRVPASRGHLRRCRSLTMSPHRLRRGALHLPVRSQELGHS